jgi:hypothetical protein
LVVAVAVVEITFQKIVVLVVAVLVDTAHH